MLSRLKFKVRFFKLDKKYQFLIKKIKGYNNFGVSIRRIEK